MISPGTHGHQGIYSMNLQDKLPLHLKFLKKFVHQILIKKEIMDIEGYFQQQETVCWEWQAGGRIKPEIGKLETC